MRRLGCWLLLAGLVTMGCWAVSGCDVAPPDGLDSLEEQACVKRGGLPVYGYVGDFATAYHRGCYLPPPCPPSAPEAP